MGLVAAEPGGAEVLAAGERRDAVLGLAAAVDHDDLGRVEVADGRTVDRGSGDVHGAEIGQAQDAADRRWRLDDDLGRRPGGTGQPGLDRVAPPLLRAAQLPRETAAPRAAAP